jgi:hypothetical protein
MIEKITKIIITLMIVAGIAICYVNFTSTGLEAGSISKYGTYQKGDDGCPGTASNCVEVWYVEDNPSGPGQT